MGIARELIKDQNLVGLLKFQGDLSLNIRPLKHLSALQNLNILGGVELQYVAKIILQVPEGVVREVDPLPIVERFRFRFCVYNFQSWFFCLANLSILAGIPVLIKVDLQYQIFMIRIGVQLLAKHYFRELQFAQLNQTTEVFDLIGHYGIQNGEFTWKDSSLVDCYENGKWLFVEIEKQINFSVLERINEILESQRVFIPECSTGGDIRQVEKHPHFRIFMIYEHQVTNSIRGRCFSFDYRESVGIVKSAKFVDRLRFCAEGVDNTVFGGGFQIQDALVARYKNIYNQARVASQLVRSQIETKTLDLRFVKQYKKQFLVNLIYNYHNQLEEGALPLNLEGGGAECRAMAGCPK